MDLILLAKSDLSKNRSKIVYDIKVHKERKESIMKSLESFGLIALIFAMIITAAISCDSSTETSTSEPKTLEDEIPKLTEVPDSDNPIIGGTPGSAGYIWDASQNGWHRSWDSESFISADEKPEWDTFIPSTSQITGVILVDEWQSGKKIHLAIGDSVAITLASNPTTGFTWLLTNISDDKVLQKTDQKFNAPHSEKPIVGVPGQEIWTFRAIGAGTSAISMEYSRSWEGGEKSAETFSLIITVTDTGITSEATPDENVEWTLVSLEDSSEPQSVIDGTRITLTISQHNSNSMSFKGSAGCNHYFGSFDITNDGIEAGMMGSTEMWCMDEQVMTQENQFLNALGSATGYEFGADSLKIQYDNGVLVFTAL